MFGISKMYTSMMNRFSQSSSYYNSMNHNSKVNKQKQAMNRIYDYYDRQLSEKYYEKMDRGIEKMANRLQNQVERAEKQRQALQDARELSSSLTEKMSVLKENADRLKNTSFSSVLKPLGYGSQNEQVASVVSGTARNYDKISLSVDRLAAKQVTHFKELDSREKNVLSGQSSMELSINGKTQTVHFNIADGATTKEALTSIASAINDSNLGVQASLTEVDGKSILTLLSAQTGQSHAFEAKFTEKLANALQVQSTIDARDAVYTVNGETKTSASNQIQLTHHGSNLVVNLKGTGDKVLAQASVNTSQVVDQMKSFISAYNDAAQFLSENQTKSTQLSTLSHAFGNMRFSSSSLQDIGVDVDGRGRLSLNENKFVEVLQKDPKAIESKIGSYNGLAGWASSKAQSAMIFGDSLVRSSAGGLGIGSYNSSGQAVGFFYNLFV